MFFYINELDKQIKYLFKWIMYLNIWFRYLDMWLFFFYNVSLMEGNWRSIDSEGKGGVIGDLQGVNLFLERSLVWLFGTLINC
jgi:hypothetical protein